MPAPKYVVGDPNTMIIVGGPYRWDGVTEWTPPEIQDNPDADYKILLESDALAQGYTYP